MCAELHTDVWWSLVLRIIVSARAGAIRASNRTARRLSSERYIMQSLYTLHSTLIVLLRSLFVQARVAMATGRAAQGAFVVGSVVLTHQSLIFLRKEVSTLRKPTAPHSPKLLNAVARKRRHERASIIHAGKAKALPKSKLVDKAELMRIVRQEFSMPR